jgi:hypothetical protein
LLLLEHRLPQQPHLRLELNLEEQEEEELAALIGRFHINRKQYRKVWEVLEGRKTFCVFKKYLFHHGAEDGYTDPDILQYLHEHPRVHVISCYGAAHPYRDRHVAPIKGPISLGLINQNVAERVTKWPVNMCVYVHPADVLK